jgi:hypothetical protein
MYISLIDEQYDVLQRGSNTAPQKDNSPNTYGHLEEPSKVQANAAYEVKL